MHSQSTERSRVESKQINMAALVDAEYSNRINNSNYSNNKYYQTHQDDAETTITPENSTSNADGGISTQK